MDGQLLGQTLNSASFFASSNLILIAAAAGVLFGGEATFRSVSSLVVIKTSSRLLFEGQLGAGAADPGPRPARLHLGDPPDELLPGRHRRGAGRADDAGHQRAYGDAAARLLNPALSSFNAGVRGYYFALAAAAWLFGPGRLHGRDRWARSACCSGASAARRPPRPSATCAGCWSAASRRPARRRLHATERQL